MVDRMTEMKIILKKMEKLSPSDNDTMVVFKQSIWHMVESLVSAEAIFKH